MTTVTKTRKQVKPLAPANGTVKVVRPIGAVNDRAGEVAINGKGYYLSRHDTGFTLTTWDDRHAAVVAYDLPLDLSSCDCPDATYRGERPGGCKHRRGLQALRQAGKL